MRTHQKTVRVGEYMGPIDFNEWTAQKVLDEWNGRSSTNIEWTRERNETMLQNLKEIQAALEYGARVVAYVDGYWREVYWVGLYDGWPCWRPVPAICHRGTLGAEKHVVPRVTDYNGASVQKAWPPEEWQ